MIGTGHHRGYWQRGTQALLGLFLTTPCPLCQRPTAQVICPACDRQLHQSQLSTPLDTTAPGLPVLSWGRYEDVLRQALRQLKYSDHPELAGWLGLKLGQTWRQHPYTASTLTPRPQMLVPIPLHASKLKQRGFNQAERLAQGLGRAVQLPVMAEGLVRVQATQAQHSLGREARQTNLAQAFRVNPTDLHTLRQTTVWIVDDIFTTGATAYAAARTLRHSGISVAGICTIARAGTAWETQHQ